MPHSLSPRNECFSCSARYFFYFASPSHHDRFTFFFSARSLVEMLAVRLFDRRLTLENHQQATLDIVRTCRRENENKLNEMVIGLDWICFLSPSSSCLSQKFLNKQRISSKNSRVFLTFPISSRASHSGLWCYRGRTCWAWRIEFRNNSVWWKKYVVWCEMQKRRAWFELDSDAFLILFSRFFFHSCKLALLCELPAKRQWNVIEFKHTQFLLQTRQKIEKKEAKKWNENVLYAQTIWNWGEVAEKSKRICAGDLISISQMSIAADVEWMLSACWAQFDDILFVKAESPCNISLKSSHIVL